MNNQFSIFYNHFITLNMVSKLKWCFLSSSTLLLEQFFGDSLSFFGDFIDSPLIYPCLVPAILYCIYDLHQFFIIDDPTCPCFLHLFDNCLFPHSSMETTMSLGRMPWKWSWFPRINLFYGQNDLYCGIEGVLFIIGIHMEFIAFYFYKIIIMAFFFVK
jgi:hypothetical protein